MTPLTLGMHVAPTGFEVIPTGPDRGKILVATSANNAESRKLLLIDPKTDDITTFLTGFSTATDVYLDPFGRLLVSDYDGNGVYAITPPRDADANLDRKVDINDFKVMAQNWQKTATWAQGDFDRDGFVDEGDLTLLTRNWDGGAGALATAIASAGLPAEAVPEPTSISVIIAALVACTLRRRPTRSSFVANEVKLLR
jgi:hypothetical protein